MDVVIESTTLKSSAYQKLVTANPSTNLSIIRIITAFITNRKSPSVRIVTGRVNKIKTGFTIEFINASTTATISAVTILSVLTPGKRYDTNNTASADAINFIIKFIYVQIRNPGIYRGLSINYVV